MTPTSPVQIPTKSKNRDGSQSTYAKRHREFERRRPSDRRPRDVHRPETVPPSVAALLAVTTIPPPKGRRASPALSSSPSSSSTSPAPRGARPAADAKPMTVGAILEQSQVSEKELSFTLSRNVDVMEILLSPPKDDADEDDLSISDFGGLDLNSTVSTRTVSVESVSSLGESYSYSTTTTTPSWYHSPTTPGTPLTPPRRRASSSKRITRRSLEPVSPEPSKAEHPLCKVHVKTEELLLGSDDIVSESVTFTASSSTLDKQQLDGNLEGYPALRQVRSAFKSNLTASIRALRSAARSFAAMNLPSIPSDDFLTRSILTIDPRVPFTDERRPPVLEEEPPAALRRYLNPTTSARIDKPSQATITVGSTTTAVRGGIGASADGAPRVYTASIQMQTYKVQRLRVRSSSSGRSPPSASSSPPRHPSPAPPPRSSSSPPPPAFSGPRQQREVRENSAFIRIAVLEMEMRRKRKFAEHAPGRARWLLPPREPSNTRPYPVTADGVPLRWVAVGVDDL